MWAHGARSAVRSGALKPTVLGSSGGKTVSQGHNIGLAARSHSWLLRPCPGGDKAVLDAGIFSCRTDRVDGPGALGGLMQERRVLGGYWNRLVISPTS